jgi:hypothetical protein
MSRHARWTDEVLARLGKEPDARIAKALGVSTRAVCQRRRALGIAAYADQIQAQREELLTPQAIALLGTMKDGDLANLCGVEVGYLRYRRKKAGIAPFARPSPVTPELLAALGSAPDEELARRFGTYPAAIRKARRERSIAVLPRRANITWTPELVGRLGTEPDGKIAKELGVSETLVSKARKARGIARYKRYDLPEEAYALLGKVSDPEMAKRFGGHSIRYFRLRKALGIPPDAPPCEEPMARDQVAP